MMLYFPLFLIRKIILLIGWVKNMDTTYIYTYLSLHVSDIRNL